MAEMWTCEEHCGYSVVVWHGSSTGCPACALDTQVAKLENEIEDLKSLVDTLKDEVVETKERLEEEKAREK